MHAATDAGRVFLTKRIKEGKRLFVIGMGIQIQAQIPLCKRIRIIRHAFSAASRFSHAHSLLSWHSGASDMKRRVRCLCLRSSRSSGCAFRRRHPCIRRCVPAPWGRRCPKCFPRRTADPDRETAFPRTVLLPVYTDFQTAAWGYTPSHMHDRTGCNSRASDCCRDFLHVHRTFCSTLCRGFSDHIYIVIDSYSVSSAFRHIEFGQSACVSVLSVIVCRVHRNVPYDRKMRQRTLSSDFSVQAKKFNTSALTSDGLSAII